MLRDPAWVRDICEAAQLALSYVEGVDQEAFSGDTQLQDAVIRRLEIIGEAARRVSDEMKEAHPEIPWLMMIGMRNRVIHMYDGVDMDLVWVTVRDDLPAQVEARVWRGRRAWVGTTPPCPGRRHCACASRLRSGCIPERDV